MPKTGAHLRVVQMGDAAMGVTLEGNPKKPEPDHFRVIIPGGDVDITRCEDGSYWVHVCINRRDDALASDGERRQGVFTDARLDIEGKHASESDLGDFEAKGLYHVAVKVEKKP